MGELEGPEVVRSTANKLIIQNFERARLVDRLEDEDEEEEERKIFATTESI